MMLEFVRLDREVIYLKPIESKLFVANFVWVIFLIIINVGIRSITIVQVQVLDGSQILSYVPKYSQYFRVLNWITVCLLFAALIISLVMISHDKKKIVKAHNDLINLFDNIGLNPITTNIKNFNSADQSVIKAWNNSVLEISNLNMLREKYFKNMVHDLKSPVQLLKMNIDLFKLDDDDNHYVNAIEEELQYLEKNINNYLLVEKITYFEKVKLEQLELSSFLSQQVFRFKKLDFVINYQLYVEVIETDVMMFERIVENIIDNAIKYGMNSELNITVEKKYILFENPICASSQLGNIFEAERAYTNTGNSLGVDIIKTYIKLLEWKICSQQKGDIFQIKIEY